MGDDAAIQKCNEAVVAATTAERAKKSGQKRREVEEEAAAAVNVMKVALQRPREREKRLHATTGDRPSDSPFLRLFTAVT